MTFAFTGALVAGSHGAARKYPDEVRVRSIRLVRDLVEEDPDGTTVTGACRRVGEQLGINTDTLRNWGEAGVGG